MNDSRSLVTQQQEAATAAALYGARENLEEFYKAMKTVAPWVKSKKYEMSAEEVMLVARRAVAMGLDPLNPHEVQIWKDWQGVQFQIAYTLQREWVRHFKGEYTEPQFHRLTEPELKEEGLEPEDVAYRAMILMKDDIPHMENLIKAGYKPDQARRMLEITGIGVATKDEWENEYFAPKGRSKAWKVKKRAVTAALRGKFGTPSRPEIIQLRRLRGDANLTLDDWKAAAQITDAEHQLEVARQEAERRAVLEEWEGLSDEEREAQLEKNRRLLRGDPESVDGIPSQAERKTQAQDFESQAADEDEPSPQIQEGTFVELVDEADEGSAIAYLEVIDALREKGVEDVEGLYKAGTYKTKDGDMLAHKTKRELNQMLDTILTIENPEQRTKEIRGHIENILSYLNEEPGQGITLWACLDPWEPPVETNQASKNTADPDPSNVVNELRVEAGWRDNNGEWSRAEADKPEEKTMQRAAAIIGNAVGGDDSKRHDLLAVIYGETSTKGLNTLEVAAIASRWEAGPGAWEASDKGKEEAHRILHAHSLFAGFTDVL